MRKIFMIIFVYLLALYVFLPHEDVFIKNPTLRKTATTSGVNNPTESATTAMPDNQSAETPSSGDQSAEIPASGDESAETPASGEEPPLESMEILEHEVPMQKKTKDLFEKLLMETTYFRDVPSYCTGNCSGVRLEYCDLQILNDHCCCDRPEDEVFNWVPHSCYTGSMPCELYADNCEIYAIIRECCCKPHMMKSMMKKYQEQRSWMDRLDYLFIFAAVAIGIYAIAIMYLDFFV